MLVCNKAVYLDIQKSGSTFTQKVLEAVCGSTGYKKHHPVTSMKKDQIYFANARNPWDYHVSVWEFDTTTGGPLFKQMVRQGIDRQKIKKSFNYFVKCLYDELNYYDQLNFNPKLEHKYWSNFEGFGIQSFRTALFFGVDQAKIKRTNQEAKDYFKTEIFEQKNVFFLEQHFLIEELIDFIEAKKEYFNLRPDYKSKLDSFLKQHKNASWRRKKINKQTHKVTRSEHDYRNYYDISTRDLIARKEDCIINTFGYEF